MVAAAKGGQDIRKYQHRPDASQMRLGELAYLVGKAQGI